MKNFWQRYRLAVYLFLAALAVILFMLGINVFKTDAVVQSLFINLATEVGGAVLLFFVLEYIFALNSPENINEQLKNLQRQITALQESIGSPIKLLGERRLSTELYMEKTRNAQKIDIIALSMEVFINNYGDDLVEWIVRQGKQFRLLVLKPDTPITKIRGTEERINLDSKIKAQVESIEGLSIKIKSAITNYGKCKGFLEIKFYEGIPYYAYFRADQEMIIGFYYSHLTGLQSECIYIQESDNPIYKKMTGHFEKLWGSTPEKWSVIKIPVSNKVEGK